MAGKVKEAKKDPMEGASPYALFSVHARERAHGLPVKPRGEAPANPAEGASPHQLFAVDSKRRAPVE
jgi:hypothetical protein